MDEAGALSVMVSSNDTPRGNVNFYGFHLLLSSSEVNEYFDPIFDKVSHPNSIDAGA